MFALARLLFALALFAVANAVAAPPQTTPTAAKEVDRNPNDYVGKKIAIDVNVLSVGKRDLDVRLENRVKPTNLKFQLPLWLADELADTKKSATMSVRIFGSLFAPTDPKGKYVVEIDEIGVLNDQHEVVSMIRTVVKTTTPKPVVTAPAAALTAIPAPVPTRATPVFTAPTPTRASVVEAASSTIPVVTETPAPDPSLPIVPIAGGLAIAVGGAFAAWMLRKRKPIVPVPPKMTAAPKPLAQTVSKLPVPETPNPVTASAPSVRDRLAQR